MQTDLPHTVDSSAIIKSSCRHSIDPEKILQIWIRGKNHEIQGCVWRKLMAVMEN